MVHVDPNIRLIMTSNNPPAKICSQTTLLCLNTYPHHACIYVNQTKYIIHIILVHASMKL